MCTLGKLYKLCYCHLNSVFFLSRIDLSFFCPFPGRSGLRGTERCKRWLLSLIYHISFSKIPKEVGMKKMLREREKQNEKGGGVRKEGIKSFLMKKRNIAHKFRFYECLAKETIWSKSVRSKSKFFSSHCRISFKNHRMLILLWLKVSSKDLNCTIV